MTCAYTPSDTAEMDSHSVIEALKQKLINEQRGSNGQEARDQNHAPSPYSRARRDETVIKDTSVKSEERSHPSNRGETPYENRDSRDLNDTRDSRGGYSSRDSRDSRDFRDSRDPRDSRGYRDQRPRDHYNSRGSREYRDRDFRNYEPRNNYRDNRDYRDQRDYRDRRANNDRSSYRERDSGHDYRGSYRDDRYDNRRDYRHSGKDRYATQDTISFRDEDLVDVTPLDKLPRKSLWDIKPKGFEKITAEKAKISGLFPLPGEARRVDISSLEGLVSGGDLNSQTAILFEQTNIDAISSRISKQLIITGVEFSLFPAERLVEVLKNYINSLELKESFITGYELINNRFLVLQLSDSNVTTILFSSFKYLQKELNLKIKIDRPEGYITPLVDPEAEKISVIPDSKDKIVITNLPTDIKKEEILDDLKEISDVEAIDLIVDREGVSKGISFVKFTTPKSDLIGLINKIQIGDTTLSSTYACRSGVIQPKPIEYRSFAAIASTKTPESTVPSSSVIVLLNTVRPEDLKKEEAYSQLERDILSECSKYGQVESIKIPKPEEKYKRNTKNLHTSIGKVFVKFSSMDNATVAANELHGRRYNERTVLVSFISAHDYDLSIF